jgi:formamidopyrimidine-DNA glycosylase
VPELLEVERYRQAALAVVGRTVAGVDAPDAWFLKRGLTARGARAALTGRRISGWRRRGKLLLMDTDGPVLGLRFGMTGRLMVDGAFPIEELEYGPRRTHSTWHRFGMRLAPTGALVLEDARRLGGVELDPDEEALGPDALTMTSRQLASALEAARAPLKATLLDQHRVAGLGNLLVDELLWRAGLDPARRAGSLDGHERGALLRALRRVLRELGSRGGSHTGDLQAARLRGGVCPRDGTPLLRRTIGGRTTYSCPAHQR